MNSYINAKEFKKAKEFYYAHPEMGSGADNRAIEFYMPMVEAYLMSVDGKKDSAEYYYRKAAAIVDTSSLNHTLSKVDIHRAYGKLLLKMGKPKEAIVQFEKEKVFSEELQDLSEIKDACANLDRAYAKLGDKSKAYDYRVLYDKYADSLQKLSREKDLALLEIDNESKRLQMQAQREEEQLRRRHNLQYIGITAGIATVFVLLVLLGFFSTSIAVIRGLGFFAFIFFFEFITLLSDNQIHEWTHGEPWKVLAIKIGLVAMLLPFHHYVEEKVVHYLVHHKKIKFHAGLLRRRKPTRVSVPSVTVNESSNLAGEDS